MEFPDINGNITKYIMIKLNLMNVVINIIYNKYNCNNDNKCLFNK